MQNKTPLKKGDYLLVTPFYSKFISDANDNEYKTQVLELAKSYRGKKFSLDFHKEYCHACYYGYVNILNSRLKRETNKKHCKERTIEIVKNYKSNRFTLDHPNEYAHARQHGYWPQIKKKYFPEAGRNTPLKEVEKQKAIVLGKAAKYKGTNFSNELQKEYWHAYSFGYIKQLHEALRGNKA